MESNSCSICGKPVLPGQPIHGARGDHWDCVYPSGYKSPEDMVGEIDAAIEKVDQLQRLLETRRHPQRVSGAGWRRRNR